MQTRTERLPVHPAPSSRVEAITWIDASVELPDSGSEVLVCFERNDCMDRDVNIAEYDDSVEGSPWSVSGGLMSFGMVVFWAELPWGPSRSCQDSSPRRVQRKRTKGWRMPASTVSVTRPGQWGNPFETASEFSAAMECCSELRHVPDWMDFEKGQRVLWMIEHLDELRGLNLACWCPPEKRCHADILLTWANCKRR